MSTSLQLVTLSTLLLSFALQVQAAGKGLTLDSCKTDADCVSRLRCYQFSNDGLKRCPTDGNASCQCIPRARTPIRCGENPDVKCPAGEGCGRSVATSNEICVSCEYIKSHANWNVLDASHCGGLQTPAPSASNSPTPAPRRGAFEMCTQGMTCTNGTKCKISQRLLCIYSDPLCKCLPGARSKCATNGDCGTGEVCATQTQSGRKVCVACNVALNDVFFQADVDKCASTPPPTPSFPPPPNGLFGDVCFDNRDCVGDYVCTGDPSGRRCRLLKDLFCFCRYDSAARNEETCTRSQACDRGETCARVDLWNIQRCFSDSVLEQFDSGDVRRRGTNGKTPEGVGNVGDACTFNFDCRDDLACTHRQDAFGGCRGRDGCICMRRALQKCGGNRDCVNGEMCVKYAGSKNKPFCYSAAAVKTTFLKGLLKPFRAIDDDDDDSDDDHGDTQQGLLTWQPCRQNEECKSGKCVHFAESLPLTCEGRQSCFCRVASGHRSKCARGTCAQGETCVKLIGSLSNTGECMADSTLEGLRFNEIYQPI